jgi:restriction system protein
MSDVSCGRCAVALDEPINLRPENRSPCPLCGATNRVYGLSQITSLATENSGGENAAFRDVALQNTVILQALLRPESEALRSRNIQALAIPWLDIVELIYRDPRSVYARPPNKWEEFIAGSFIKGGFEEVTVSQRSHSHDKEVMARKKNLGTICVIDSFKAYRPGRLVKADDVKTMWSVLQDDKSVVGIVSTNSKFEPRMRHDPFILQFLPSRLELIEGDRLANILTDFNTAGIA